MPLPPPQWAKMPRSAKTGIGLYLASWVVFLVFIAVLIHDLNWIYKLALAAAILTYCLLAAINWARMIAMMANLIAILFLAVLAVAFNSQNEINLLVAIGNLVLYGFSTYYLFIGSTAQFFKVQSQPNDPQNSGDGVAPK